MRRILVISWAVAALACGSVKDRQACGASTECPVGQYCARAGGESRCWADAMPPTVQSATASCATTPCLRDGVLHVEATITDDAEVLDASVSLDLVGGSAVPMTWNGSRWVADVELRGFPFQSFSRDVVATVTARDGARTPSSPLGAAPVAVTRLRWTFDAGAPITSPAVMEDGTAVVGVSASSGQVSAVGADGVKRWSLDVGDNAFVTAAPAITGGATPHTIWVGSEDFKLYGVEPDGSALKVGVGVNTGGAIKGSIAVIPGSTKEWAFAASDAGFLGVASGVGAESDVAGPTAAVSVGPVIAADKRVYIASTSGALRAYRLTETPVAALAEAWAAPVMLGGSVTAPIAIDRNGAIWTATVSGQLGRTLPADTSGALTAVANVGVWIVDSPIILANDDVVVGDQTGVLHRFTPAGAQVWTTEPNLGAAVHAPAALAGGDAAMIVPTASGKLFALRDDGSEVWSTTLDPAKSLRAPNIYTILPQSGNRMSTAYLASSSGKLFAVIVDGELDTSAPWPKAFQNRWNGNYQNQYFTLPLGALP